MASAAQKRALLKYEKVHAGEFKRVQLKFKRNLDNKCIICKLESVPSAQAYIKELILKDIEKAGG